MLMDAYKDPDWLRMVATVRSKTKPGQCVFALPNRGGGAEFVRCFLCLCGCHYDHVVVVGLLLVADPRASTLLAPRLRPQLQSWLGPALGQLCRQVSCWFACLGGVVEC